MSFLRPYIEQVQREPIVGPIRMEDLQRSQPINREISAWYASLSKPARKAFREFRGGQLPGSAENLDLVQAVQEAITELPHLRISKKYERTFELGEGEERHNDNHDIVITQTNGAGAEFRLWEDRVPDLRDLRDGDILLFQGRVFHEVGPAQNALRVIRAVGLDYVY